MANTRNKLLTALLTIIALFIGQKAFATEYTLTYTVHLYVGQNGLPYVYPGYGPCDNTIVFSGPSSDHYVPSCSVFSHTHAGQYQNCNLSPSINGFTLDLDDGIRLQAVWENGFIGWYNDPDNPDNNNIGNNNNDCTQNSINYIPH